MKVTWSETMHSCNTPGALKCDAYLNICFYIFPLPNVLELLWRIKWIETSEALCSLNKHIKKEMKCVSSCMFVVLLDFSTGGLKHAAHRQSNPLLVPRLKLHSVCVRKWRGEFIERSSLNKLGACHLVRRLLGYLSGEAEKWMRQAWSKTPSVSCSMLITTHCFSTPSVTWITASSLWPTWLTVS